MRRPGKEKDAEVERGATAWQAGSRTKHARFLTRCQAHPSLSAWPASTRPSRRQDNLVTAQQCPPSQLVDDDMARPIDQSLP